MSASSADARIIDRGYRPYDGPRLGPSGAIRSLMKHTAQRVMGLRRPLPNKILPMLSAVIAYVPAIVFVGLAALITGRESLIALTSFRGLVGLRSCE